MKFTLGFPLREAFTVNLVEENPQPIPHDDTTISFSYRPFEIKTFLVHPAQ